MAGAVVSKGLITAFGPGINTYDHVRLAKPKASKRIARSYVLVKVYIIAGKESG